MVLHSLAKQLKAKRLDDWYGWVKTINGAEERTLAVYEITIKKVEGNFVTILCYGTDEIAYRPQIETMRFNRLLNDFGLQKTDVDNSPGYVGMMLGLKCQQLQTSKVKRFYSDNFPERWDFMKVQLAKE